MSLPSARSPAGDDWAAARTKRASAPAKKTPDRVYAVTPAQNSLTAVLPRGDHFDAMLYVLNTA